ncbi:hypothetical protein CEQ90_04640 [Lewinellaceae bacterium SD302]|nr:hypothetical protein CEQ90_04640 [Lewinellaceae bacterium SD302]
MKKYLFASLLSLALFACDDANDASTDGVPASIVAAFNAAYPNATDVEWDVENDSYEVEFEVNGEEMEINYDGNGNIVDIDD